ncbi:MAG: PH domain-containing protein [Methanomicrobiaceae archaeon]|nr:PH domain-containing protein [Methanomicrobiaceae archaeon]
MAERSYEVGKLFAPAPEYRSYLYTILVLVVVLLILPWLVPVLLVSPMPVNALIGIPILAVVLFTAFWIPLYYASIAYELTPTEISWKRGVWFQQTGIVPYNRITNVDIMQGPVMRYYAFSALRVQTAGYSAQARAEIHLSGIEQPQKLQDVIMQFVRKTGPVATEGEPQEAPSSYAEVIAEIRAIRGILDERL